MEGEETFETQMEKHEGIYKTQGDEALQAEMMEDLKPLVGKRVRVPPRPNPMVFGKMQKEFKGILKRVYRAENGALLAEVLKEETGGTHVFAAGWISKRPVKDALARAHKSMAARALPAGPPSAGRAGAGAASSSAAPVRAPREPRGERTAKPCHCGCGATTGGGAFMPGHDARLVSMVVKGERPISSLATFPKLLAKAEGRMGK